MSMGQIVILAAVVGAFVLFAAVLAWGDYRAQQAARRVRDAKQVPLTASTMASNKPSKSAAAASATAQARWPQPPDDRLQHVA